MATDQATADYEYEQGKRAVLQDYRALERSLIEDPSEIANIPSLPVCAQCINWRAEGQLHLADGTTQPAPGYCEVRAAADLLPMSQSYAQRCQLYEEAVPF